MRTEDGERALCFRVTDGGRDCRFGLGPERGCLWLTFARTQNRQNWFVFLGLVVRTSFDVPVPEGSRGQQTASAFRDGVSRMTLPSEEMNCSFSEHVPPQVLLDVLQMRPLIYRPASCPPPPPGSSVSGIVWTTLGVHN